MQERILVQSQDHDNHQISFELQMGRKTFQHLHGRVISGIEKNKPEAVHINSCMETINPSHLWAFLKNVVLKNFMCQPSSLR